MAIPVVVQTLSAAFSFGILLQAATGALFSYYRGHGSTIFQDGRRLVLVLFLFFAALWAQIDFINLLLPTTAGTVCQATLIISTMFDQLARVGLEQFLLWSVGHGTRLTAERLVLQGVLLARLIAGGLLIGFTRPQFEPVCLARTSILPIAIIVLALDAIIVAVLLIRAASLGMFGGGGDRPEQNKALVLSIFAFGFWTATSVPLVLGIPSIILILRTVLPANGLLVLVGIVTIYPHALLSDREQITTPEAQSPFVQPMPPAQQIFQENMNTNGSPTSNHNYTKSGFLFVVNPSTTPRDSPRTVFANSPRNDNRGLTKMNEEGTVRDMSSRNAPIRPDRPERNAPGYRGSSGVFPSILSAPTASALAPQIRPDFTLSAKSISGPVSLGPSPAQKRGLFNFTKTPTKPSVRSLGISQPVALETDNGAQAFAKIQTIDLTTAALNERERREGASARAKLVANRPAPQPPAMSSQDAFRRSISVKRKQMPVRVLEPMPTVDGSVSSSLEATGSTTSASLSPGREEVRRRSPRQMNTFERTPVIDANTGRPTQLQRQNTSGGLPSNPRVKRFMNPGPQPPQMNVPQQTVMFMNDIVYDNPGVVKTIIRDAPGMYAKGPRTAENKKGSMDSTGSLRSADSIIHRPRPYTRDQSKDRSIFPSAQSPGHRRSRSGSSIAPPRKSILMANPGSPTTLPPLPAPPTTAAALKRLLPNDTKSMTFDEKIELLFPAPPNVNTRRQRRSSVPSLPRMPSVFMFESPQPQSPTEEEIAARRTSKRTTIASFLTNIPPIPPKSEKRESVRIEKERQTYRFSANTYRTIADEVGETWIPGIQTQNIQAQNYLLDAPQRQSVMDDMRKSHWTVTTSSSEEDDATTYWGSVHDDVPAIDIPNARQNARSTFIKPLETKKASIIPSIHTINSDDARHGEEIVTVMLDSEENTISFFGDDVADTNRRSFFLDAGESLGGEKTPASINERGWHKRIGDELPTFSERKEMRKSRKMPPPTPLLLNRSNGRKASVVVKAAEPSPPSDSPERAIAEIQAQLRRFEEPSRGSVGSILRALPGGNDAAEGSDRLALLDNLEKEMGQQENHWQQMQTNLDRDSMNSISMIMSPDPMNAFETAFSRDTSQRSSRVLSRVSSRRARIRSSLMNGVKSQMSTRSNSTESSDNSRASIWQQRLAEAQNEYMENAPVLLRKKSLNFLSVSKSHQLGSPTPPDSGESESDSGTDIASESDSEMEGTKYQELLQSLRKEPARLWKHSQSTPSAAAGRMWNPPFESVEVRSVSPEPPAKNVRPVQRRAKSALPISSSELWTKPQTAVNKRPVVALWGSKPVRPVSIVTRRVTSRPQRKSKRVTILPDIVESPVPLPNKRETLGIFQFPWGETSDQPVYQPTFNPTLLAGFTPNASLEARARQIENLEEYSSSFFDDYDDDFEGMDTDSDDDFDESTLWEIASLLNSNDVPSMQSLLPPAHAKSIEEDFDEESDKESAAPPAVMSVRPLTTNIQPQSQLWISKDATDFVASEVGLPQPEASVWNSMITAPKDAVRSNARNSDALPVLLSKKLWTSLELNNSSNKHAELWQSRKLGTLASNPMWSPKAEPISTSVSGLFSASGTVIRTTEAIPAAIHMVKTTRPSSSTIPGISSRNLWSGVQGMEKATQWLLKTSTSPEPTRTQLMWAPVTKVSNPVIVGLFDASIPRSVYRSSTAMPAATNIVYNPRTIRAPLSQLTSTKLWSGCNKLPVERDWISESSIRPESPSIYSTSSSGSSSPVSDSSSVKSSSTKASSIWGPIAALKMPSSWFERKTKKPTESAAHDSNSASKIPVRQGAPLVPLRESRVLASRDIWEAKAPVVEKVASQKFREGVASKGAPRKPRHYQHRSAALLHSSWDNALDEAIAAGTQKKSLPGFVSKQVDWDSALNEAIASSKSRLQRPQCSPQMWANALSEAVAKSQIPRPVKAHSYDSAVLHPVFFTKSLATNASEIHPAATGYVVKKYDSSVLHPVFFTESLVSTTYDVHPAAIGHVSKVTRPGMWTSASPATAPRSKSLWSKDSTLPRKVAANSSVPTNPIRKASLVRAVELPVLESKTFWQPSKVIDLQRNWIASTTVESPKTWTPQGQIQSLDRDVLGMWCATAAVLPSIPDIFTDIKSQPVRKATAERGLDLPVLESTDFWKPSSTVSVERNWISSMKSSSTWVKRSQSSSEAEDSQSMWTTRTVTCPCSPDMFAHVSAEPLRQTPRQQKVHLPTLQSKSLWERTEKPSAQRIWIKSTLVPVQPISVKSSVVEAAKTWTPRRTARVQISNTDEMWSATASTSQTLPDMFTRIEGGRVKKASSSRPSLLYLKSTELYTVESKAIEVKVDWLHSTSRASPALTWTAPPTNQATLPVSSMWEGRSKSRLLSPALFENPHSQPWTQKKHDQISLSQLESTELWRPAATLPAPPKNWLVNRRFSKVEFRY